MRAWLLEHLPKTGFDQFRIRQDKSTEPERVDGPNGPITFSLADWWDPGDAVILPAIEKGYPWGGVGTAFDYRLRYLFDAAPPERLVAHRGMQRLSIVVGKGEELRAWIELKEALGALGPHLHRGLLDDPSGELRLNHLWALPGIQWVCG